ncbi:uncharacterized protein LOC121242819 [Juglans microcarpa x Juglans regia]|uniref:uncharacterized protein LOC121242819 n=1 Tax=Juglans microcarpa x Juglans regia TaxID=2249226 RepID=UPI001B7DF995|nr:uncharacterized protein LOC121242819 [Juglans microcarpa x Juglans regia]
MEGLDINVMQVWTSVKMWLKKMVNELKVQRQLNKEDLDVLNDLNLELPRIINLKCRLVKWSKPPSGWVKLNCDGSCRNNPRSSGGGGILQDMDGQGNALFGIYETIGMSLVTNCKEWILVSFINSVKGTKRPTS